MKTSRSEAKAAGHKKYMTGKSCSRGHVSPRWTSNGSCCECILSPTPESKNLADARQARYREKHRIKIRIKARVENKTEEQRLTRNERDREKQRTHNLPEHRKAARRAAYKARRSTYKTALGNISAADIEWLEAFYGKTCLACSASLKDGYHVDHIYPLSRGGSNLFMNLQILCPACNMSKRNKLPVEWANRIGRPDLVPAYQELTHLHECIKRMNTQ